MMAAAVKSAGVQKRHVRFVLTQDVAGAGHEEIIDLRPLHEVLFAALLPAFTQEIRVALQDLDDLVV